MFVPPTPFGIKDTERIDRRGAPLEKDVTLKGVFSVPDSLVVRFIDGDETIEQDLQKLEELIKQPFILATHAHRMV
jgi:hypothetical protein